MTNIHQLDDRRDHPPKAGNRKPKPSTRHLPRCQALPGWDVIDADSVRGTRPATADMLADYLSSSRNATWRVVASPDIDVLSALQDYSLRAGTVGDLGSRSAGYREPIAVWIGGAAGSGKSTALMQTVWQFVTQDMGNRCAFWQGGGTSFDAGLFPKHCAKSGRRYLIAIDNAGQRLGEIHDALVEIWNGGRDDIDVAFACNQSDWERAGQSVAQWKAICKLVPINFRHFTQSDAIKVAKSLIAANVSSTLSSKPVADLAAELHRSASDGHADRVAPSGPSTAAPEAAGADGPLLGALLSLPETRNRALVHISDLLTNLERDSIPGAVPYRSAFMLVAAAQHHGLRCLTPDILARAVGADTGGKANGAEFVKRLEHEALVIEDAGNCLFTRHPKIAEAVTVEPSIVSVYRSKDDPLCILLKAATEIAEERKGSFDALPNWDAWQQAIPLIVAKSATVSLGNTLLTVTRAFPDCAQAIEGLAELGERTNIPFNLALLPKEVFRPPSPPARMLALANYCRRIAERGQCPRIVGAYFLVRSLAEQTSVMLQLRRTSPPTSLDRNDVTRALDGLGKILAAEKARDAPARWLSNQTIRTAQSTIALWARHLAGNGGRPDPMNLGKALKIFALEALGAMDAETRALLFEDAANPNSWTFPTAETVIPRDA